MRVIHGLVWMDLEKIPAWFGWLNRAEFTSDVAEPNESLVKVRAQARFSGEQFTHDYDPWHEGGAAIVVDPYTQRDYGVDLYLLRRSVPQVLDWARYEPGVTRPPQLLYAPLDMLLAWSWYNMLKRIGLEQFA